MNRAKKGHSERGTSTLEFLVVLPMLLFILLSIMEWSRALLTINLVITASREGARVGSVTAPLGGDFDPTQAENRIKDILGDLSNGATLSVVCSATPCVTGSQVTANVQVTFDTVVPLVSIFVPMLQNLNINKTTVMRFE